MSTSNLQITPDNSFYDDVKRIVENGLRKA